MSADPPTFYTVAETAMILKCSARQVSRLIQAKRLMAIDIGTGRHRDYRIAREALYAVGTPPPVRSPSAPRRGPRVVPIIIPDPFADLPPWPKRSQ
ncbi:MAG: hypothetical protein QOF78_965 [Phycisphaerales bacterium]|jgi:excisionase family DNA binding protein|nr:hypothetical protein [Phycisphaerales bacterium]